MDELFYKINHKNTLHLLDNKTLSNLKSDFFIQLSSQKNEVNFSCTINKFLFLFTKIPNLNHQFKNKINVIEEIVKLYSLKMNIDSNDYKHCFMLCQKLSLRNYKTEFVFQSSFVEEIAIILCYGFKSLLTNPSTNDKSNPITFNSFLDLTEWIRETNIDIVNKYRYNNSNGNDYNYFNTNSEYGIPNELILLMNKFTVIKKLILNIDEWSDKLILAYTLIILNYNWLFYYILDVTFDVSCVLIQKKIWTIYESELYFINKEMKRKSSVDSNDSDNANKTMENETIWDLIDNQKNIFLLIILYSHFISKLPHLAKLSIIIPQNFKNEIINSLSKMSIKMKPSFHFLNILTQMSSLSALSIEFNSLEASSFENIITIIHHNTKLKYLTLGLFSKRDDHYYSSPSIYKTALDEGINLASIISQHDNDLIVSDVFCCNSNDFAVIDNALIQNLLPGFEENMEKLFILLQNKKDLISFELHFDIPKRLIYNEKYYFTLLKFILNIFLLLHRERIDIKELNLISPMMLIDNRRYPLLDNYFEGIDLLNKNKRLNQLHLHFNFISLANIVNVLSIHLKFISLGELDLDTFNSFISFYQCEHFANKSTLVSLSLSLSKTIFDFIFFKPQLTQLIKLSKPLTLRRFALHCNAVIKAMEMTDLLSLGNGNQIEKYFFLINKINKDDYIDFGYNQFYYLSSSIQFQSFKWTIIHVLFSLKALSNNIFNTIISFAYKGQLKKQKEVVIEFNN